MSNILYRLQTVVKRNVADLILLLFTIIVCLIVTFSVIFYKKNNIKKYNMRLFEILEIQDNTTRLERMEKLYYDKGIPKISKGLCGMKLSQEYFKIKNIKNFIKINEEIMNFEKDIVFKNITGLNILYIKLNEDNMDVDYLEKLFSKLENKKNPFLNVVREKKAVFYLKQGKKEEAIGIFNDLILDNSNDSNFKNRIRDYIKTL
jgi:tetratricopeptide (TPR) repeat protein